MHLVRELSVQCKYTWALSSPSDKTEEVQRQMIDLQITNRVKDGIIKPLQDERKEFLVQLTAQCRSMGKLETTLGMEGPDVPREGAVRLRVRVSPAGWLCQPRPQRGKSLSFPQTDGKGT